ncbi:hypothetical protein BASA83_003471 [Batrachochytrium salamandrivorans]|nr:hypothetical protein BASA83_003471 [Batrachochytrium salamandrivorans]
MLDPLLWVLPYFTPHYAGQTTQGDTNDGGDANQASGYNQDTSLPQRTNHLRLTEALQKSSTPDQNDASLSADPKPKKVCKSGNWLRRLSKSCPQQQSQPEPLPSTSYDHPQLNEMPLPAYVRKSEAESYSKIRETDQYIAFTEEEAMYFESEYLSEKIIGEGLHGMVYLATRKSDGKKVACKSIPYTKKYIYTLESVPPPRCHLPSPLVLSEEPSVAQCMSSRPLDLLIPREFATQMYLSRPGYENPHVPMAIDYYILENEYILVMEYVDEQWVSLSSYVKEKGQLDIKDARDIVREVVNGMMSLKQHGVVHGDLSGMSQ